VSVERADQLHVVNEDGTAAIEQVCEPSVVQVNLALDAAIIGKPYEIDLRSHGLPSRLVEHLWNLLWDLSAE
jgi:hypothetical protein